MSAFQEIAEGRTGSLVCAALEFARDEYPGLDAPHYFDVLKEFTTGFELYRSIHCERASPAEIVAALNDYFFNELGFSGSTEDYYDPRNSYLNDVIDRRVGIPISLSILYRELAASADVDLCGVNLPGHFMLAYPPRLGRRTYIDVFHGGHQLDWKGCCERIRTADAPTTHLNETEFPPMSGRDILVRMLRNLKGIYSNTDAYRALQIQERLVRLLPDEPAEQRDLGLLFYRNGKPILALKTLQELIRRHPKLGEVEFIRESLRQAAKEAALVN